MKTPFLSRALTAAFTGSILAIAVLAGPAVSATDSPSVLLQKGIYAEETEGNVDAAIKIYEQITAEAAANHAVATQAQYRLALCYQKKGQKEPAIGTLTALLRQLSPESDLTPKVRQALADLGQPPANAISLRQLPLTVGSMEAVSEDGRYVAYITTDGDNLAVCEMATGRKWTVAKLPTDNDWFNRSAFSPDGTHLAYCISGAIYTVKTDGTDTKLAYKPEKNVLYDYDYWVYCWSRDGNRLVVGGGGFSDTKTPAVLSSLDLATGRLQPLPSQPTAQGTHSNFSWSGRYLAFNAVGTDDHRPKIFVFDLESGGETVAVDREPGAVVGWSPDDSKLVFGSERTGALAAWAVPMREGKPVGEAELIKADAAWMVHAMIARTGDVFYTERKSSESVYVGEFNFKTGALMAEPRRIQARFPGVQRGPKWSRDGRKLLVQITGDQSRFMLISTGSEEVREVPWARDFRSIMHYSWSEEGEFVVALAFSRTAAQPGIYRFDLASSKKELLVPRRWDIPRNWVCQPVVARDGLSFFYIDREFFKAADQTIDWTDQIVRRELATGREEKVYRSGDKIDIYSPLALSPDGTRLAFVTTDEFKNKDFTAAIRVLVLGGTEAKELHRTTAQQGLRSLAWTPDGNRLLFTKTEKGQTAIWSTAVDSGTSVRLAYSQPYISDLALHPDGRQIAFRAGSRSSAADMWIVEGLLPKSTAAQAKASGLTGRSD